MSKTAQAPAPRVRYSPCPVPTGRNEREIGLFHGFCKGVK